MAPLALLAALAVSAGDVPSGRIVDPVECESDPSQSYAIYLPSHYSSDRTWPVIFAFDPAARGRVPVERYQAAAEAYGYIVAGSNNSRNGSWQGSQAAVHAMTNDVSRRFAIDEKRIYTAGFSGGARIAMAVTLANPRLAGVIASSGGFPDSTARKSVPFVVFGTAGTEDFNYLEMRQLDRGLTTPHRLAIFEGGHTWLSSELAMEAVEWLELQAMKSARAPRDQKEIDRIFAKRTAAASALRDYQSIAADFEGLVDVSAIRGRAAELSRDKHVRDVLKKERQEEAREEREIAEIISLERQFATAADERLQTLSMLRDRWKRMAQAANAPEDSAERRMARRMLRGLVMGASDRALDPAYRKIIDEYRPARGR
jgi:poly(3-hydroxybutyrate) depolymerase